jgi:hypothetical protein
MWINPIAIAPTFVSFKPLPARLFYPAHDAVFHHQKFLPMKQYIFIFEAGSQTFLLYGLLAILLLGVVSGLFFSKEPEK